MQKIMPFTQGVFNSCCKILKYKQQDTNVMVGRGVETKKVRRMRIESSRTNKMAQWKWEKKGKRKHRGTSKQVELKEQGANIKYRRSKAQLNNIEIAGE